MFFSVFSQQRYSGRLRLSYIASVQHRESYLRQSTLNLSVLRPAFSVVVSSLFMRSVFSTTFAFGDFRRRSWRWWSEMFFFVSRGMLDESHQGCGHVWRKDWRQSKSTVVFSACGLAKGRQSRKRRHQIRFCINLFQLFVITEWGFSCGPGGEYFIYHYLTRKIEWHSTRSSFIELQG